MPLSAELSEFIAARYAQLIARCREANVALYDDAGVAEHLQRVLLASDFAFESFRREPALLGRELVGLMSDPLPADARRPPWPQDLDEAGAMSTLRKFRLREALRLIWRDVNRIDSVEQTLAGSSALAETCLDLALAHAQRSLIARHGEPRDESGKVQRLVVLAFGKLGGGELNFSSDIDLILAFAENGQTDGARSLANEAFFARVGQQLVKLLAEITVDGYVFRVDLRLRPFGSAGRIAMSFSAMEQYYQREGRDWERYAWIKARPVAGDIAAGNRLIELLRPFVYRRYLDYTAFAGLREMKALIDAEVARKDLAQHLKLGPGGIREIEFIVQLLQLIRGGRDLGMRKRGLLPALAICEHIGALSQASAKRLRAAYLLLRQLENRVQMLSDEQTHELPEDDFTRARLAAGLGYAGWPALESTLAKARDDVTEEYAALIAPVRAAAPSADRNVLVLAYWQKLGERSATTDELLALGFASAETLHGQFGALVAAASRTLDARARACFDRLLPLLIESAAASVAPDVCLERLIRLVHSVLRRSPYLALLEEHPAARARLLALFANSALLAERVIAHPLLLDDLLDARIDNSVPGPAELDAALERRLANIDLTDAEAEIEVLQEEKQSATFRIGLASSRNSDAIATSRALSNVADGMIARTLSIAERDVAQRHGVLPQRSCLAVIGYGSLGGAELGFASDLDLVFVYDDAIANGESNGERPLEGPRYVARLAQRVVHWLTVQSHAGRLYEVDVRLRPDGGKGMLVVSLDAFAEYQRERAWIWEQQALVRARVIAGDAATGSRFAELRAAALAQPRDAAAVREQVTTMRARWRAERDRSTTTLLDLKQGAGTLLDIEFLLQALVLMHAHEHSGLLASGNTAALIAAAAAAGVLDSGQAQALAAAHSDLLGRALACTLDARPRLVPRDADLARHSASVLAAAAAAGLTFA
ncbi:MAG TPA: bifunctional [glutamate--ammonia ligase]-adenylyl-L-tyrosine phosphorylase/[glutamate--ammonia-ligase] adenylyltransferase [Rudaea sp.]|nr:bifunctional [glutamate--ammonia ligase]-adenylyl-L-tyrosine phosphorylase/[glutamate--ammonia-ligase] adenylyltransferase [Rudaea sp.]